MYQQLEPLTPWTNTRPQPQAPNLATELDDAIKKFEAAQAAQAAPIDASLASLRVALQELHSKALDLHNRLAPVMRGAAPSASDEAKTDAPNTSSRINREIESLVGVAQLIHSVLSETTSRLEV